MVRQRLTWGTRAMAVVVAVMFAAGASARGGDRLEGLSEKLRAMKPGEQIEQLRGLVLGDDADARVHFYLGNAFFALEQYDSAVANFEKAVSIDPAYSKAYVNMGITYDTMGRGSTARTQYLKAIEINPKDVLAYCHLGYNHFSQGEVGEAISCYEHALEIDPNSAQAHYNLGLAFANSKMFKEALVEWKKVIAVDPDGDLGRVARENVDLIKTYMSLDD